MNQSNSICFICLNSNNSLKAILQNGSQNDTALQVQHILPEITIWDSVYICSLCCTSVHTFHMFKKKCLENYSRLMHKTNFLQGTSDAQTQKCNMKHEHDMDIELNEELIIKEENANMENLIVSDNSEPECFPQPEFVKCEIESDCEQDCSSSEYKNTFDKEETHTDNENYAFSENADLLQEKELCKDSDDLIPSTPPELREQGNNLRLELIPEKSKLRYERIYKAFVKWCNEKQVNNFTENVLLAYFRELVLQNKKSLWAIYSMLKSCVMIYNNTDISKYPNLIAFLKRNTANYKPKSSKVLEEEYIHSFIEQAPDKEFLMMKVVLIIGVSGPLRREELYNMVVEDVELQNDKIIITIPETKSDLSRQFFITNSNWIALVKKYLEIRLAVSKIKDRFFLTYQSGRCLNLPVGINSIGKIPSKIANFLKLENCHEYTGRCFRRSSATVLANRKALVWHGGWKTVPENTVKRKINMTQMITEAGPSTSKKTNTLK